MNQSEREGTSQDLIKELRTGRLTKVTPKKCVRDLRYLSVIIDPTKESEWAKGVDIDQLIADQVQEQQQEDDQKTIRAKLKRKLMKMRNLLMPLPLLLPLLLPLPLLLFQLSLRLLSLRLQSYQ